ncbi:MAG: O-antigen ligase family protein [Planctomycetota bacterium]|jgi:hypothetical protein
MKTYMINNGKTLRPSTSTVYILGLLPILDMIVGQVHGLLDPHIGTLSIGQVYHGVILLFMLVILSSRLRSFPRNYQFVLISSVFFAVVIILPLVCSLFENGNSLENFVSTGQIIYWLVFWLTFFVVCRKPLDCHIVLTGIILAGVYASLSVLYFYITESAKSSGYTEIKSSFGGWNTAKTLTGPIITSAFAALWMCRKKFKKIGIMAFFICTIGLMLTYQRAGQVAIVAAALWLLLWYIMFGRRTGDSVWTVKPIVLISLIAVLAFTMVGISDFTKRWEDTVNFDFEEAGSTRLTLWTIAANAYKDLDLIYQLSGIGFESTLDKVASGLASGARRHTHSDWFDIPLMFGVFGIIGWVILNLAILRIIFSCGLYSAEFAVGMAIFLILIIESFFTGQMLAPHAMSFYLITISCIVLSAQRSRISRR